MPGAMRSKDPVLGSLAAGRQDCGKSCRAAGPRDLGKNAKQNSYVEGKV